MSTSFKTFLTKYDEVLDVEIFCTGVLLTAQNFNTTQVVDILLSDHQARELFEFLKGEFS